MEYIKSHSNYVLKKKHQTTNNGVIYERDITTIGGLNQFSPNQVPMYKSGNFIITVNNESVNNRTYVGKDDNWVKNGDNGTEWTLDNIVGSDVDNDEKSLKIVLKQDYYKLSDFAYYGSCVELIRASIIDIATRFPGELYVPTVNNTGVPVYYKNPTTNQPMRLGMYIDSDGNVTGLTDLVFVENPHGINIHTAFINENEIDDPLKYVCISYNDYDLNEKPSVTEYACVQGEGINGITILTEEIKKNINDYKINKIGVGGKIADIILPNGVVHAYVGDEGDIVYLTSSDNINKHLLTPKDEVVNKFFNTLDNFQKILMNRESTPKYSAVFEVLSENDFGYKTELKKFTFPTTTSNHNLSVGDSAYNVYINELLKYAEFYDEYFCDNLWRSMTHESIKNFDWTFTRDYGVGEEDAYVFGGTRIQKTLRLFGREFDEIKSYIDALKNYHKIEYGKDNAIPDYFLTDVLSEEGWEVKNIYPYYGVNDNNETEYNLPPYKQLTKLKDEEIIKPYSTNNSNKPYGFFDITEILDEPSTRNETYHDTKGIIPLTIQYFNESEYDIETINNHFFRMLKLNSKDIFRKKGTIQGIESLLSLFGLKSRRWVKDRNSEYDFDIIEKITATNYIRDRWITSYCMHELDWHNKNKTIVYDTDDFRNGIYHSYQGLPVRVYKESESENAPNHLYPYFSSNIVIDGNPYYQMNGGWMKKKPYTFGLNDVIVSSTTENGETVNLYKETYRTLREVNDLKELVSLPKQSLRNGDVYKVKYLDGEYALIDGIIYDIEYDVEGNAYIPFNIRNNSVKIGSKIFLTQVTVTDKNNGVFKYVFSEYSNNTEIRAYIQNITTNPTFKAYGLYYAVNKFQIIENGKLFGTTQTNVTNYFMLKNVDNKLEIGGNGWNALFDNEPNYLRLETIIDNFKGNNPHNGNMIYDGGKEYISYFTQLFKEALNGNQFNHKCYGDAEFFTIMDNLKSSGFTDLTDGINANDYCGYNTYNDSKIHYLGNVLNTTDVTSYHKRVTNTTTKVTLQNEYPDIDKETILTTDISDHIMNIKVVDINFYLNETNKKMIKFFDDVIMNYLEEMIPSTLIVNINYCEEK